MASLCFVPYSVAGFQCRVFMARTSVDPSSLLKNMGQEVRALDPGVQISRSGTLEASLHEFYRGPLFELAVLAAFAVVGLLLVVIGIFSVMACTVTLQTHEIGIRMALGAQRENILTMILAKGVRLLAVGIVIGLFANLVLTRFIASQIWGVSLSDPWTYGAVIAVIVLAGLTACILPARRAASVDPPRRPSLAFQSPDDRTSTVQGEVRAALRICPSCLGTICLHASSIR
jgi:putative ABC transport system permease protein